MREGESREEKGIWGRAFVLVYIIAENSCISPFYFICEPINCSFHRKVYVSFLFPFSFSHSLFLLFPLCKEIFASFQMVFDVSLRRVGQGWPWESGHDVISRWLRWRSTPKYVELGDGDGLWGRGTPLPAHITSHVRQYHLLSLSVRDGSGWPLGTCYTLTETISLSPSLQLVLLTSLLILILTSFSHFFHFRGYVLWSFSLWSWKSRGRCGW